MSDKYVLVAQEADYEKEGPLVWEQYLRSADLESIVRRAYEMEKNTRIKSIRIAKLQFLDKMGQFDSQVIMCAEGHHYAIYGFRGQEMKEQECPFCLAEKIEMHDWPFHRFEIRQSIYELLDILADPENEIPGVTFQTYLKRIADMAKFIKSEIKKVEEERKETGD